MSIGFYFQAECFFFNECIWKRPAYIFKELEFSLIPNLSLGDNPFHVKLQKSINQSTQFYFALFTELIYISIIT